MRRNLFVSGVLLSPVLILAGCGMNTTSSLSPNVESPAISGRSFGGQNPISGATISVVAMGTSGYGSTGTVLASTVTDSGGNFSFAPGAYACPQPDTPVYLLGIGGDPGIGGGSNPSIVTAAGLGTCTVAKSSYVVMNEVTTAALAFALAHFFSPTLGGANAANDWFGGPSITNADGSITYSRGLVLGNSYTIPAMVNNSAGAPNQPSNTSTVDADKINTIANVLAACVNSSGATSSTDTSSTCGKLFYYTTPPGSTTSPSDTLQAAVQMALRPYQQVAAIFNLITPQAPFSYSGAKPNDWTIAISYTTPTLSLAVDSGSVTSLDIDRNNKVWFPSNGPNQVGAAYFDPYSHTFNGPFNSTGLIHPQQVAIDGNGYAWYNDSQNSVLPGYNTAAPNTTQSFSLINSVSDALTIGDDNRVNVGIDNGNFGVANISADRTSYTAEAQPSFNYPVISMAGDASGGEGLTTSDYIISRTQPWYDDGTGNTTQITTTYSLSGQVVFTGNDFVSVQRHSSRIGSPYDGLCIFSQRSCFLFGNQLNNSPIGMVIDGASNLWIAESGNSAILNIPVSNPTAGNGTAYFTNGNPIPYYEYPHGNGNGGLMTKPAGIAVDAEGNVWVSNAGCTTSSCNPGTSFTLTEVVGVATPTITPVSQQITGAKNLVGTEPTY